MDKSKIGPKDAEIMSKASTPPDTHVPEAARVAYTCRHEFQVFNPLDLTDISVYCRKCGTTVKGNKITPPVAHTLGLQPSKELEWEKELRDIAEKYDYVRVT